MSGELYEYSEDFKNRFVTKDQANALAAESRQKIEEYRTSLAELAAWREYQQERVDSYFSNIDELSSFVMEMKEAQDTQLSSWFEEQNAKIDDRLEKLMDMQRNLEERVNESEDKLRLVSTEVAILSGALTDIRKGQQEVLGERYEA